jgi:hypothetical protein
MLQRAQGHDSIGHGIPVTRSGGGPRLGHELEHDVIFAGASGGGADFARPFDNAASMML